MEKTVSTVPRTTTSKRLIKLLESMPIGYRLTIYFNKKFIDEYFIDYLKLIERDSRFKREDGRSSKSLISSSIELLIKSCMETEKRKVLQRNQNNQVKELQEEIEEDSEDINEDEISDDSTIEQEEIIDETCISEN